MDQRSGTIVLGSDVRISRVAVSQGNLTLRVTERPFVVQPNPFSDAEEAIVAATIRNGDGCLIQNTHKSWAITSRGAIHAARADTGYGQKRRCFNQLAI